MTDFDNHVRRVRRLAKSQDIRVHKLTSGSFALTDRDRGDFISGTVLSLDEIEQWLIRNADEAG